MRCIVAVYDLLPNNNLKQKGLNLLLRLQWQPLSMLSHQPEIYKGRSSVVYVRKTSLYVPLLVVIYAVRNV